MKYKIGIITITLGSNFGNRLQNYALQETIKKLGGNPFTIKNLTGENKILSHFHFIYKWICKAINLEIVSSLDLRFSNNAKIRKKIKFVRFDNNYINWCPICISKGKNESRISRLYDAYICGSDQIWNPFIKFNSDIEYLSFVNDKPKISYAASFGINDIEFSKLIEVKELLKDFKAISLREERGIELLNSVGLNSASLVLDPTLLLTIDEWNKIEVKPKFLIDNRKYILVYNLKSKSEKSNSYIKRLQDEREWDVIDILDTKNPQFYGIGPNEFLYLIHNAEYICTDSFHATVFSLIYHKQFAVFNRANMNSRIETLLKMSGLEDRILHDNMDVFFDSNRFENFEKILNEKRIDSKKFLISSLEVK